MLAHQHDRESLGPGVIRDVHMIECFGRHMSDCDAPDVPDVPDVPDRPDAPDVLDVMTHSTQRHNDFTHAANESNSPLLRGLAGTGKSFMVDVSGMLGCSRDGPGHIPGDVPGQFRGDVPEMFQGMFQAVPGCRDVMGDVPAMSWDPLGWMDGWMIGG